jgi:hypothetical protein
LTFKATDGSNTIAYSSQFTMSNTAPVIGTAPSAAYALAEDGTPTIITLAATDADGHAITWSYEVVSGLLGGTAVSIVGSVFTITPSTNEVDAGEFQLRFIASDGASFDAEVSAFTLVFLPDWTATTLLHTLYDPNAYGTINNDNFGSSVAISSDSNYIIVGAEGEGDAGGSYSGKAYIFDTTTGALLHTLTNPNPYGTSQEDHFGTAVAIDGNYAVVGAPGEDSNGNTDNGSIYIFDIATGALVRSILGYQGNSNTGQNLSMSGNYLIVGIPNWDLSTTKTNTGQVFIYNVVTGNLVKNIPTYYSNPIGSEGFGSGVAISGNYAIIGCVRATDNGTGTGRWSGRAYIIKTTDGSWTDAVLVHTLNNPNAYDTQEYDSFGVSVAISGNYVIVGAHEEDDAGGLSSGKAYIFDVTTGALVHTLDNPNPVVAGSADEFGRVVVMSGNYAVVGAPNEEASYDEGVVGNTGKAYIFDVTTGALVHTIDSPVSYSEAYTQNFSQSLAIVDKHIVVGTYSYATLRSGRAYIFKAG